MKPDMSFTQDVEWQIAREKAWAPLESGLKTDFRKKEIACIKQYFFTGVIPEGYHLDDDGALLSHFPLVTPEGWDYVLQYLVKDKEVFEYKFYYSIYGGADGHDSIEKQLDYIDYFHPDTYQPVIKSRVPVGKEGEVVTVEVDLYRLFCFFASRFTKFVERGGEPPLGFYRLDYFFSMLPLLDDTEENDETERAFGLLRRIMKQAYKFSPKVEYNDTERQFEFLNKVREYLEGDSASSSVKELWVSVKKELDES